MRWEGFIPVICNYFMAAIFTLYAVWSTPDEDISKNGMIFCKIMAVICWSVLVLEIVSWIGKGTWL